MWVLKEKLASKRAGVPTYFKTMTGIGPASTTDLAEAARFPDRQAAIMCPAYYHSLSFYEPEFLSEAP